MSEHFWVNLARTSRAMLYQMPGVINGQRVIFTPGNQYTLLSCLSYARAVKQLTKDHWDFIMSIFGRPQLDMPEEKPKLMQICFLLYLNCFHYYNNNVTVLRGDGWFGLQPHQLSPPRNFFKSRNCKCPLFSLFTNFASKFSSKSIENKKMSLFHRQPLASAHLWLTVCSGLANPITAFALVY